MQSTETDQAIRTLTICREIEIAAPPEVAFQAVLDELGPGSEMPDGTPFPMKIEPWPGGRWFRDLGNSTGHLWGHVQVIKPPGLLEICGPMFMSYPATNFVQYRLIPEGGKTRLKLTHRAMGQIPADVQDGAGEGWEHGLRRVREIAEGRAAGRR
ncbi:MAG: SRPBCC domain-containing protein [Phycisphaerales bacterium]